ncbi:hypothetical protein GLOIN_2v1868106 [Rhizophagus irregularis DAOM 181602=DAOM 197198]|nr:hypothetical protein GLOIN_2v1868106 [Rhizophagus irregularis DAOM 181602=DAOM 197198]
MKKKLLQFQLMIEDANPELKGFFPSMVNAIIPKDRSEYNKQEAKKSIVALCYIIAGLRNKFVNQFKTEVGLYLVASGATWEAIDTLSSIGYSACAKTVMDYQKKIQLNHITKIEDHFLEKGDCLHIYNIDDYHDIHEKRRPDTVTTSTAKHFSTCVAKPVMECFAVPIVFNGVSVHNPNNVEAPRICWYLLNKYTGNFDITYTERQIYWISQGYQNANTFDRIELLTIHCYDDAIAERKDERSMKDLQLIGFKEQHLHSMQDYLNALQMILTISRKTEYLDNYVAPIVADWPGQLFIRKALTHLHALGLQSAIPKEIESFIPMLGPLHLSLNSREHVMIIHHSFFEQMFHFVFGKNKKLAKKPKPWRINLLLELARSGWVKIKNEVMQKFGSTCKDVEYRTVIDLLDNLIPATLNVYAVLFRSGSFEKYVETVFRIWTFALRWKRKNYNKAPLIFLSDLFYWQDNHHPFADAIKNYLPCFNDYYVENTHSRIRANTSSNATAETIIKQAYVIADHDPIFKDTFRKTRNYSYNLSTLKFLSDKTSLFLLNYFRNIFHNQNNSTPLYNNTRKKEKKLRGYKLATLGKEVDLRHLPTAYSTSYLPKSGLCDNCGLPLNNNGVVLACGHGYHPVCYGRRCVYCENFYKKGIFENVNSFLKRVEKGTDTLTQDDLDDEINEEEEEESEETADEEIDVSATLEAAINNINYW